MTATITLASIQADLATWTAARTAAADGLSISVNGRSLTTHNLTEINNMIASLSRQERSLLDAANTGRAPSRLGGSVAKFS